MSKKDKQFVSPEMRESAHKIWLAGLGALAKAEEEGTKLFNNLVEAGEEFETRGKKRLRLVKGKIEKARDKAESTLDKLGDSFDDKVAAAVQRLGVPSRDEIQRLTKRVEELTTKVDQLKPAKAASRKRTTKKSSTSKS